MKKKNVKKHAKPAKKKMDAPKQAARTSTAQIEFCQKCGSILVPVKKGSSVYLRCRRCGTDRKKDVKLIKIVEEVHHKKGVTVLEKDTTPLPLTEKQCPKCEHPHAHWWLQQTRSADEPPTQFFRCEKCRHTWREYK